jgi:uncharacterized repeat protein (TIGR03803 family)
MTTRPSLKGALFGTTSAGGTSGNGTVFKVNPATGAETVLHSFAGGNDGANPRGSLLNVGGMFYGTTAGGGASGNGTVFKIDPATGAETVLYAFAGGSDGANPVASLINVNGALYGTTAGGGTGECGTVFAIDPATGNETIRHSFANYPTDGCSPAASLINVSGVLYGTTTRGGVPKNGRLRPSGFGTVFALSPTTGDETVLHSFGPANQAGHTPSSALLSVGDSLYGATAGEWETQAQFEGTIFQVNRATGGVITSYAFPDSYPGGGLPLAALVKVGGKLYGATSVGGLAEFGTIFTVTH